MRSRPALCVRTDARLAYVLRCVACFFQLQLHGVDLGEGTASIADPELLMEVSREQSRATQPKRGRPNESCALIARSLSVTLTFCVRWYGAAQISECAR